jgi:hypothetical protein
MEAEFRESQPCDKKNCIKFGVWISKVPERGYNPEVFRPNYVNFVKTGKV